MKTTLLITLAAMVASPVLAQFDNRQREEERHMEERDRERKEARRRFDEERKRAQEEADREAREANRRAFDEREQRVKDYQEAILRQREQQERARREQEQLARDAAQDRAIREAREARDTYPLPQTVPPAKPRIAPPQPSPQRPPQRRTQASNTPDDIAEQVAMEKDLRDHLKLLREAQKKGFLKADDMELMGKQLAFIDSISEILSGTDGGKYTIRDAQEMAWLLPYRKPISVIYETEKARHAKAEKK